MGTRLVWDRDGLDWPHRVASRFVNNSGLTWHVQQFGRGPLVLLVHGTAASTHSWKGLAPLLAADATVLSVDLPGHAFTSPLSDGAMTVSSIANALGSLLQSQNLRPTLCIGHSAGVAILVRMCRLQLLPAEARVIGLNGALLPFDGFPGRLFSPLAKILALNPLVPQFFSWQAKGGAVVSRILTGTGSRIDEASLRLYERLFRNPEHVAAALAMMAHWELNTMPNEIASLSQTLTLIACSNDRAVPAEVAFQMRDRVPSVRVELVRGLGHLAHEEQPSQIAQLICSIAGMKHCAGPAA